MQRPSAGSLPAKKTAAYARALDQLVAHQLPAVICTIYEARFPERQLRRHAATGLAILNDIITREAFARDFDCIDLRVLCNEDRDFANPIEPSAHGGAKIARAILNFRDRRHASASESDCPLVHEGTVVLAKRR